MQSARYLLSDICNFIKDMAEFHSMIFERDLILESEIMS